jgi:hypothetical protein
LLHIAFASLKKLNETRNANDKATSERTAGNLLQNFIIAPPPLLPAYETYIAAIFVAMSVIGATIND